MAQGDIGTNYAWYNARKARNKNIVGLAAGAALLVGGYLLGDNYLDNYKPFLNDVKKNTEISTQAFEQASINKNNIGSLKQKTNAISSLQDVITNKQKSLEQRLGNAEQGIVTFKNLDIDFDGKTEEVKYFPVANVLIAEGKQPVNAYEWAMESLARVEKLGLDANIGNFNDVVRFYQVMAGDANLEIEPATIDELKKRYFL